MPEAAPVFAEITASELRGSRGRVIAGIKTGAVEVGIYIRADSAAEAALCWGLRDALREQGRFILPVGMRLCDIGTAEVPFSSVQRYAVFALWL